MDGPTEIATVIVASSETEDVLQTSFGDLQFRIENVEPRVLQPIGTPATPEPP